jgi:hypothetical protein
MGMVMQVNKICHGLSLTSEGCLKITPVLTHVKVREFTKNSNGKKYFLVGKSGLEEKQSSRGTK